MYSVVDVWFVVHHCMHNKEFDMFYADKSDDIIMTLESDNLQLVKNIESLETQYSSLNQQLDDMRNDIADRRV